MTTISNDGRARIGIVDDHEIMTEALVARFCSAGFIVLPPVAAVERLDTEPLPDLVVCDMHLPGLSAGKAVAYLVERGCHVLATTGVAMPDEVLDAIAAGARGFVEKTAPGPAFVQAANDILAGKLHVSARLAGFLIADAERRPLARSEIGARERGVLRSFAQGDTPEEVAGDRNLTAAQLQEVLTRIFDAARRRRRLNMPSPREAEVMVLIGCQGLAHKEAARLMKVKVSVIPDFLKSVKAKYLATHPDADETISPGTAAQQWARELGMC